MYPIYKKIRLNAEKTIEPDDCFVEKARNWFWVLGIIVVGTVVFLIIKFTERNNTNLPEVKSTRQYVQAQKVVFNSCPYCPGILDSQGRCNIPRCPIYSQNWGKIPKQKNISKRGMLIKGLAMKVDSVSDYISNKNKRGVIIHSVYGGGRAERAGLEVRDIIVRFNGRRVKSLKQFQVLVAQARPESDVKIQVIRNGNRIKSVIRIGEGEMEGVTIPNHAQVAPVSWMPAKPSPWCYRR